MKIAVTLCLLLFTLSVLAGTLRDDFNDGNVEGWRRFSVGGTNLSDWYVEMGVLVCHRPNPYGAHLVIGDVSWQDYTIECDVKLIEVIPNQASYGLAGIVVYHNHGDSTSGYYIGDFQGVMSFWAFEYDHGFLFNQTPAFPIALGKWYHMKVETSGKKYSLEIDGKIAHQFTGTRFDSGRAGLGIGGVEAHFDNIVITGNNVPDVGPSGYHVQPRCKLATTWGNLK